MQKKRLKLGLIQEVSPTCNAEFPADGFQVGISCVPLTEHWLSDLDSSVRAELCPNGYKFLDHTRSDRRGGGTGIIYHESLDVKKIDAGVSARSSYEFSEWLAKSGKYSIRIVIIYRPPYSERHPVTTNEFFAEFPDYLESLLLCKERLLIADY